MEPKTQRYRNIWLLRGECPADTGACRQRPEQPPPSVIPLRPLHRTYVRVIIYEHRFFR